MRFVLYVVAPWIATALFWLTFVSCIEAPPADTPPIARIVVAWEPTTCGDPHRVVLELEDDDGAPLSRSVPCELGGISLDAPHFGIYRGRLYAWRLGEPIAPPIPVRLVVDEPVVRWFVVAPQ